MIAESTLTGQIKNSLDRYHHFTEEHINMLAERVVVVSFKKNDCVIKPGRVCDFVALVLNGSFRLYREENDKEQTLQFFCEQDWMADPESFIGQSPAANYIKAMEDAEVATISIWDIHGLIQQNPRFFIMGKVMEKWSIASSLYSSIISQSPEERYRKLLQAQPGWIIRFPQMYIASYLGMTQETLSRVKGRIQNSKTKNG